MFLFQTCPHCRASTNDGNAQRCERCGKPFDTEIEVADSTVPSDAKIRRMGYRDALKWCAGIDGILCEDRLQRVAAVKKYDRRWVLHRRGRHWESEWDQCVDWRDRVNADDE
jgi:hypothetical protein